MSKDCLLHKILVRQQLLLHNQTQPYHLVRLTLVLQLQAGLTHLTRQETSWDLRNGLLLSVCCSRFVSELCGFFNLFNVAVT